MESHEIGLSENLSESTVLRSVEAIKKYSLPDLGEFSYACFLTLCLMAKIETVNVSARGYAYRIKSQGNDFKRFTFIGTDLYMYLNLLFHGHDKVNQVPANKAFLNKFHLTEYETGYFIREFADSRINQNQIDRFLLRAEKELQVQDSRLRSARRIITDWESQTELSRKYVINNLISFIRGKTPNSDLLVHLDNIAKQPAAKPEKHNATK